MSTSTIPITFDKSHLTTIGTRLYAESLDLVRELVANAYDADATKVKINITESELTMEDDGSGMDRDGLVQYFTIGSVYKKLNPTTPQLSRRRIGEFGIGKFAVLSLCDQFTITTRKNGYAATVIFDKNQFETESSWDIPVVEGTNTSGKNGTRVTLSELRYPIGAEQLERRLRQQLPLTQKDFAVYINGTRLAPHVVPGRRYKIREQTQFGAITGEIILSSLLLPLEQVGVAIKVRGMTVRRESLGLDKLHQLPARRLTGEIHADFLPLTTARDNFITDAPEYVYFQKIIGKKVKRIAKDIKASSLTRRDIKTDQALSNALQLVKQALRKNPNIFLMHDLPLFSGTDTKNAVLDKTLGSTTVAQALGRKKIKQPTTKLSEVAKQISNRKHRSLVKTVLRDKNRLIKRIKIGGVNLVCSLSHLGDDETESFVEGGIIFINRDHPLFVQTVKSDELTSYHLARLITQELTKLAKPVGIEQAYDWQSRLLTDALVEKKKNSSPTE